MKKEVREALRVHYKWAVLQYAQGGCNVAKMFTQNAIKFMDKKDFV